METDIVVRRLVICIACLALVLAAVSAFARDASKVREFRRHHPCPSTGRTIGACPGYVADHKWPLCAGGPDEAWNLQWQKQWESYEKDKVERHICRQLKAQGYKTEGEQ